jgi:2-dehydropantoate 2-reductase
LKIDHLTIVGAGGIGGLVGAYLTHSGFPVTFVDKWREHVDAINRDGLRVDGVRPPIHVHPKAIHPEQVPAKLDAVAIAVKSHHTESALDLVVPRLSPDGFIVSLQNGFNHELVAARVGESRTIGTVPNFGGGLVDPGVLEYNHHGILHIGEWNGELTDRIRRLAGIFEPVAAEIEVSRNIVGDIWGKQVYFSLVTLTALVDAHTNEVLSSDVGRRLAVILVREAVAVADAAGIRIDRSGSFDAADFRPKTRAETEKAYAYIASLVTGFRRESPNPNYKFHKTGSGVWWDIVVRKRASETRGLTGAVVERGKKLGVPVPLNDAVVKMIYEIEDGRRKMGWDNVHEIDALSRQLGIDLP